jgi:acyl dehydratase
MPIQPEALLAHVFPDIRHHYTKRDAILYALGVGLGRDPIHPGDLPFLLEDRLRALPTLAVTLGSPGSWIRAPQFGVNYARLVHYEQAAAFHTPLPAEGEIVSRALVISVADRGEGRGAVVVIRRDIRDAAADRLYCTLTQTLLLRGDGGFGGPPPAREASLIPDIGPDVETTFDIDPRAALIYRLSGDWNPLHADPTAAKAGGFDRPILHGLASYAVAGVAVSRACGLSPEQVTSLRCRFTGVVFPGDTLTFRIWRGERRASFQGFVGERKALDQGVITFAASA